MTIETYLNANFPLASDASHREARAAYYRLRELKSLTDPRTRRLAHEYAQSLTRVNASHCAQLDHIHCMSFENIDRRTTQQENN